MLRRHLWKLTLSAALVLWAVFTLMPLKDQPFGDYVKKEATAKPAEFAKLMGEVSTRIQAGRAPSVYVALKQIGLEQKLDLSQFFPEIRLESTLTNVEKRNNILLNELLRRSKSPLQLGLDLKGGVAYTLEIDAGAVTAGNPQAGQEKLSKAIEIIDNRINGLGVTEPIIRAVGTNRIEVQLPGVSTKDNPEIATSLVKPARLDFRMVHPFIAPPQEAPPGYERMVLEQEGRQGGEIGRVQRQAVGGGRPLGQDHRRKALEGVADQGEGGGGFPAGAQHVGGAGIPGTVAAGVGQAVGPRHQDGEGHRAHQVGGKQGQDEFSGWHGSFPRYVCVQSAAFSPGWLATDGA